MFNVPAPEIVGSAFDVVPVEWIFNIPLLTTTPSVDKFRPAVKVPVSAMTVLATTQFVVTELYSTSPVILITNLLLMPTFCFKLPPVNVMDAKPVSVNPVDWIAPVISSAFAVNVELSVNLTMGT